MHGRILAGLSLHHSQLTSFFKLMFTSFQLAFFPCSNANSAWFKPAEELQLQVSMVTMTAS